VGIAGNLNVGGLQQTLTGNVGIGSSVPLYSLDVVDQNDRILRLTEYSNADGAIIRGFRARGTVAAPAAVQLGDHIVAMRAYGYNGTVFNTASTGEINLSAAEAWTPTANGTEITFRTTPTGTTSASTAMRFTADGHLLVGTLTVPLGSSSRVAIKGYGSTNGGVQFANSSTGGSNIGVGFGNAMVFSTYTGDIGSEVYTEQMRLIQSYPATGNAGNLLIGYTASNGNYLLQVNSQIFATSATIATSDQQYKDNITPLGSTLDMVLNLRPVTFDWRSHPVHNFTDGTKVGFIAQDVQHTLKDQDYLDHIVYANQTWLPDGTAEPFLGLNESGIIPLLVKALQELSHKHDALAADFAAYKDLHP